AGTARAAAEARPGRGAPAARPRPGRGLRPVAQRALPVRLRQEVQAVPRRPVRQRVTADPPRPARRPPAARVLRDRRGHGPCPHSRPTAASSQQADGRVLTAGGPAGSANDRGAAPGGTPPPTPARAVTARTPARRSRSPR